MTELLSNGDRALLQGLALQRIPDGLAWEHAAAGEVKFAAVILDNCDKALGQMRNAVGTRRAV
jgi:hypothetical protein